MTYRFTLSAPLLDRDVAAAIASLLAAAEDACPRQLDESGDLSVKDLHAIRNELAEGLWSGRIKPGQVSLGWLHRDCRWLPPGEGSDDSLVQSHQATALLDALGFLIALMMPEDRLTLTSGTSPAEE